jgi:uncharacterized membrane protein
MTDNTNLQTAPETKKSRLLWRGLLLVSLMGNLLVAGMVIGHVGGFGFGGGRPGGPAYAQFIPGRFFHDLARDRRRELGDALHANRTDMQKLRAQSEANAQQLAAELEKDNYDAARVGTLIDSFTTGPDSLAAGGGKVLKDFYAKLTPDERKQLAKAIHDMPPPGEGQRRRHFWN